MKSPPGTELPAELFAALFKFKLDEFQLEALRALGRRNNVVVSAPTGSGKTVAGELAIYYALALGLRVFYTTPLKALSNQKFSDFRKQYGEERVGLLTGDSGVNRDAQIVVMTTEVYRNMLYESGKGSSSSRAAGGGEEDESVARTDLRNVFAVVFDEFHYMNDPQRGTVWEESVISSPSTVLMVALSATVANVDDITGWFSKVHGQPTTLVTSDFRPVPLRYYFAMSDGVRPLFKDVDAGPGALKSGFGRIAEDGGVIGSSVGGAGSGGGGGSGGKGGGAKKGNKKQKKKQAEDGMKKMSRKQRRLGVFWEGAKLNPDLEPKPFDEGQAAEHFRRVFDENRWSEEPSSSSSSSSSSRRRAKSSRNNANSGYALSARSGGRSGRPRGTNEVPSYPYLVRRLGRKDMLPAIVFIFSRAGCDRAAREVARSNWESMLTEEESAELERRLKLFEAQQPEGTEVEPERMVLLRAGVGIHHAGLLPLHKTLVEDLFNEGLLKVCFATETLAAGVNMPARTTVISVLSKRTDRGVGSLTVAQLLQMAGRAGRRGKDVQGNVVLMRSRFENAQAAHKLLLSPIDAIDSHFRSSYGMVATILRKYTLDEARELVERSFGSFLLFEAARRAKELESSSPSSKDDDVVAVEGSARGASRQASTQDEAEAELSWAVAALTTKLSSLTEVLDQAMTQGGGVDASDVKSYVKLRQRIESEQRIASYLTAQRLESEADVMRHSILPFARLGSRVLLRKNVVPPPFPTAPSSSTSTGGGGGAPALGAAAVGKGDEEEEGGGGEREAALLGDAPVSFDGRRVPLFLVLLRPSGRLALVEPRHVQRLDPSDQKGLRPAVAVALQHAIERPALPWQRQSTGVWLTTGTSDDEEDGEDEDDNGGVDLKSTNDGGDLSSLPLFESRLLARVRNDLLGKESMSYSNRVRGEAAAQGQDAARLGEEETVARGSPSADEEEEEEKEEESVYASLAAVAATMKGRTSAVRRAQKKDKIMESDFGGRVIGDDDDDDDEDDEEEDEAVAGEVAAQENLVDRLYASLREHPLHDRADREQLISAVVDGAALEAELRQAAKKLEKCRKQALAGALVDEALLKSKQQQRGDLGAAGKRGGRYGSDDPSGDGGAAWAEFSNVAAVLKAYGALQDVQEEEEGLGGDSKVEEEVGKDGDDDDDDDASSSKLWDPMAEALFSAADVDGSGSLTKAELWDACKELPNLNELLVDPILLEGQGGSGGGGGGSGGGGQGTDSSRSKQLERIGLALERMDVDGDGSVSLQELKGALRGLTKNYSDNRSSSSSSTGDGDVSERKAKKQSQRQELTAFGELVASLSCDNELWLALALQHPSLESLSSVELAGVVCSLIVDYGRPDLFTLYGPSSAVMDTVQLGLAPLAETLIATQMEYGVGGMQVQLDPRLAGLVESWADGFTDWSQLCASTSLDQGDLCRVLRRTLEVLRSMALSSGLESGLRDRAREAMNRLDRPPVTDDGYVTLKMNAEAEPGDEEDEEEEEDEDDDEDYDDENDSKDDDDDDEPEDQEEKDEEVGGE